MGTLTPAPLYVCVHLPEFPAQARLRLRPELAQQTAVVLDGTPPLEEVCSMNRKAHALGITRGMTRAELDSFQGITLMPRSSAEEHAARNALLNLAGAWTPRTQLCVSPDPSSCSLVLDMAGTERIFGKTTQAIGRIRKSVLSLGLSPRLAAGSNYLAAVCAAPFATQTPILMQQGREHETLNALPLSALGLTEALQETFTLWGLRTLGELAALPEVELIARLGQQGQRLRRLARGEHPHLMVPEEPVLTLEEHIAFDTPVEMLDSLLFVLSPMIDQLVLRAHMHALALASLAVQLTLDGGGEHTRTLKPALPLADRSILLKLLHLDLQAHPPSAGVMAVHLHAEPGKCSTVQTGLFTPPLPEPMRLDVTLARIAAMVGEGRVGRARLLDTHRPEGFVMERFTVPNGASTVPETPAPIALRRLRPPAPLHVRLHENQPEWFAFSGKRYTVTEAYGPWRRSGDWWSESVWSHEEWDVCASAASGETLLCILAQDLLRRHWQLEALYD